MGSSQQTPTTTTQIQKTELPAWVDAASQENYGIAASIANRPFQQYQGPRVAGLNPLEQAAAGTLQSGMDAANGYYGQAGAGLGRLAGGFDAGTIASPQGFINVNTPATAAAVNPMAAAANVAGPSSVADVLAKRFSGEDLKGYINPYTDNVVSTTLAGMDRGINTAQQMNSDANRASGSWGGSRDAISNAVIQSEGIRNKASTEAGLRSAAYTDAAGRLMQDNAMGLQAGLANQQKDITGNAQRIAVDQGNQNSFNQNNALNAGILQGNQQAQTANNALSVQAQGMNQSALQALQGMGLQAETSNAANRIAGANIGLQASSQLGQLGDSVTNSAGKNALLQSQIGANARSVEQAGYDAAQQKFLEEWNAPVDNLNTRLAALGMSPYGKTTSSTETKQGGTASNTAMSVLGGVMSFLPLMFSDERLKKNVRTEGTTEAGVPLKSYEYKGFMGRKMPGRQIGVMAQDLEKVRPDAVHRVRGDDGKSYRAVDYSKVGRGFMGGKRKAA